MLLPEMEHQKQRGMWKVQEEPFINIEWWKLPLKRVIPCSGER